MSTLFTDFSSLRSDFPILQKLIQGHPLIYFDSAATAQKPDAVIDAISSFYREEYGTVHRAIYQLAAGATSRYHAVRKQIASFIGAAHEEEIIFTRGTTDSINLIASSFGKAFLKKGDEVLISQLEHHSNIVPWQLACAERGAILRVIPADQRGVLLLDEAERLMSEKTKIVSIAHISNSIGTIQPVEGLVALAKKWGAKVLIDGAQAAPHLPVNVRELGADFYVFSGHKIYGPTGIGVLYGRKELLELLPPYQGGGDMIEKVEFEASTYNVLPFKFEAGTPSIAEVIGLGAAIDYVQSVGIESIQKWENTLLNYATAQLLEIPQLQIIGTAPHKGAIISFLVKGIHPLDIGSFLDQKGIAIRTGHHCAQPAMRHFGITATARLSFGLYNTLGEIDRFITVLKQACQALKS